MGRMAESFAKETSESSSGNTSLGVVGEFQ
jgi:hypothetical protein